MTDSISTILDLTNLDAKACMDIRGTICLEITPKGMLKRKYDKWVFRANVTGHSGRT